MDIFFSGNVMSNSQRRLQKVFSQTNDPNEKSERFFNFHKLFFLGGEDRGLAMWSPSFEQIRTLDGKRVGTEAISLPRGLH
jgi:hypothetical protein